MAILHSLSHRSKLCLWVIDEQRWLTGRGYDGRAVRIDSHCSIDTAQTITPIGPLLLLPVLAFASFLPHSLPFVYCPEDGRSKVLLQTGIYIPVYMASQPRRLEYVH